MTSPGAQALPPRQPSVWPEGAQPPRPRAKGWLDELAPGAGLRGVPSGAGVPVEALRCPQASCCPTPSLFALHPQLILVLVIPRPRCVCRRPAAPSSCVGGQSREGLPGFPRPLLVAMETSQQPANQAAAQQGCPWGRPGSPWVPGVRQPGPPGPSSLCHVVCDDATACSPAWLC